MQSPPCSRMALASEDALRSEFLRNGAPHTPAHTDRQVAVVYRVTVRQDRVAAVRLPLGRGADDHTDRLSLSIGLHCGISLSFFVGRMKSADRVGGFYPPNVLFCGARLPLPAPPRAECVAHHQFQVAAL